MACNLMDFYGHWLWEWALPKNVSRVQEIYQFQWTRILVNEGTMLTAVAFNILAEIPSGPFALLVSREANSQGLGTFELLQGCTSQEVAIA